MIGLALWSFAPTAAAAIIVDNGPPDQLDGQEMSSFVQAQDFTLAASTTLSRIRFWTIEGPTSFLGSVTWAIYTDIAGTLGGQLAAGAQAPAVRTATGNPGFSSLEEFVYEIDLGVTLGPGTYWVSLHNGPESSITALDFFWGTTAGNSTNPGLEFALPGGPWLSNGAEHAFQILTAEVPEPATIWFGLLAFVYVNWMKTPPSRKVGH